MRVSSVIVIVLILFSCNNYDRKKSGQDFVKSEAFARKFPLHDLKHFDFDSLEKVLRKPGNNVDTNLVKILLPDSMSKDFYDVADSLYYCSVQHSNRGFKSYVFLAPGENFSQMYWINYDPNMHPVGVLILGGLSYKGDDSRISSQLNTDNTFTRTSVESDIDSGTEDDPDYRYTTDSTIEKIKINNNGRFTVIYHWNFHKEVKINNEELDSKPDSGKKL
jgi:hypothetical protein